MSPYSTLSQFLVSWVTARLDELRHNHIHIYAGLHHQQLLGGTADVHSGTEVFCQHLLPVVYRWLADSCKTFQLCLFYLALLVCSATASAGACCLHQTTTTISIAALDRNGLQGSGCTKPTHALSLTLEQQNPLSAAGEQTLGGREAPLC